MINRKQLYNSVRAAVIGLGLLQTATVSAQLEEVIVTAQKRSESVQDVPIAINALDGSQLDAMGVADSSDLAQLFPNLSLKAATSINMGFAIRGVGTQNFHVTAQQAVGQYMDEVSLVSPFTSQMALFDMQRVEVLRGPQNTLFGRNTTGGAINFISVKPEVGEEVNGFARAKAGNEGALDFEGAVSFPLGSTTAARIAVQSVNRDGVFNNLVTGDDLGKIERNSGRFQIVWEPSDKASVLFNAHAGYNRSDAGPRKTLGRWEEGSENIGTAGARGPSDCGLLTSDSTDRFDGFNTCVSAVNATATNPSTGDWNDVLDASNDIADVDFEGAFVKIEYEFEHFGLTAITSYDQIEVLFQPDSSGAGFAGFFPGQDAEYEVFSQELRIASITGDNYRWIGGFYYSNEDDTLGTVIRNGSDGTPPFSVVPSVEVEQEVDIWSLYGQGEFDFTERLTFTLGLRFTDDSKEGESTARVIAGTLDGRVGARAPDDFFYDLDLLRDATSDPLTTGICPPPVGGLPCKLGPTPVEQDLQEWGGKIGLDYAIGEDALLYASYSRGFKSGAFDTRALAAFAGTADKPTAPEFLDAFEIGAKSTLLDSTLELNGAIFYYEWEDLQTFDVDLAGNPAFVNVPESELYGLEIEAKWAPDDTWHIQGGIGYIQTEITDVGDLVGVKEGAVLGTTPELTWSGLILKTFTLDGGELTAQTSFNYSDDWQGGLADSPIQGHEDTFFINARLTYLFGAEEQYQVALWGDNLSEEKACSGVSDIGSLSNGITCLLNAGMAFYGITAQMDF